MSKKGLLERLKEGILVGDGGFVIQLEKRGYVKAGPWTPEAAAEHPDAVKQLHKEFLRAGSDFMTAFTFHSADDKLNHWNNNTGKNITCKEINESACKIAREVGDEGGVLVGGSIAQNPCYTLGKGKEYEQKEVKKQIDLFVKGGMDFIIFEFFRYVEELEWCIEEAVKSGLPVVAQMCIGPLGDYNEVTPGDCAVRMAKAGAAVVGLNCSFDPTTVIKTIKMMKEGLVAAGLNTYLITQPNGYWSTGLGKEGWTVAAEYPYALETRLVTRMDVAKYAREAYDLGVRIIGGCCGFEAYHIRAISEELHKERNGFLPPGCDKSEPDGKALRFSGTPEVRNRANREYWATLVPDNGRPDPPTYPTIKN